MEEAYLDDPASYARVSLEKRNEDTISESDAGSSPYHSLLGTGKQYRGLFERQLKKLQRRFTKRVIIWTFVIIMFLSHVIFFSLGLKFRPNLDRTCMEHTSTYSPVLKEISSNYKKVKFNGTLGFKSEYSGDPSPEVDAAWAKWAYVKYASIPEDEFMKLDGADPDASRLTPEYGGGYIGFLEVSHQLHCLNLLRKGIHKDYYMQPENIPEEFTDRPWTVKLHLTHCIEILRQNIMCNADVGIITHQWIVQSPDPFANFNNWHMCRDLESVENWIHSHEIPTTPDHSDLPIPLGSKIYPTPP